MTVADRPVRLITDRPAICPLCDKPAGPRHFYRSGKARCQSRRFWTKARLFRLMGLLEQGRSDVEIGKVLGCSSNAVNLARKRHGIKPRRLQRLTARAVARTMGVACAKTVAHWIHDGFLPAHRVHGFAGRPMWHVDHDALWDFIADERTWHLWTPERITDTGLRRHAEQVRGEVRFLTPREFAEMAFVQHSTVNQWIHKGWLPARRWGNWWIDSRVAASWTHELGCSDVPSLDDRRAEQAALAALGNARRVA
jgi:hypothetical protein